LSLARLMELATLGSDDDYISVEFGLSIRFQILH